MFNIRNILLVLHAVVLMLTLSIVMLPDVWMIKVVGESKEIQGVVFPLIWTIYAGVVFLASAFTFSWLIQKKQ